MNEAMNPMGRIAMILLAASLLLACGDKQRAGADSASATASSAAPGSKTGQAATASPAKKEAERVQADKEYVQCHWTKSYQKNDFQEEQAEFECKNTIDKDFSYLQFKVFYYDKDKKQVDAFLDARNGQPS